MWNPKQDNRVTLLVIPNSTRPVRKLHVTRRGVRAAGVMTLAALLGTGAWVALEHRAQRMAAEALRQEIERQQAGYEELIDRKQSELIELQNRIAELSAQAAEVERRLAELRSLEKELQGLAGVSPPPRQTAGALPQAQPPVADDPEESASDFSAGRAPYAGAGLPDIALAYNPPWYAAKGSSRKVRYVPGTGIGFGPEPKFRKSGVTALSAVSRAAVGGYAPPPGDGPDVAKAEPQRLSVRFQAFAAESERLDADLSELAEELRRKEKLQRATPSIWPTRSRLVTSGFGYRRDPFTGKTTMHEGLDIDGKTGDDVYAAAEGTVLQTGFDSSRGHFIVIRHTAALQTIYMHLSKVLTKPGRTVKKGELIGRVGSTGRSTGSHLHYQVEVGGKPVNPAKYLPSSQS
ncbi:peptidoglycan DD-metalloendopeptidase family protein [Paenibacillus thermoaerophilus]|uniref:Peptidoglycan DD-metalloendopeptidase family protein n=1 Tax=Paenibacillus thermoaerophilus TaxID=1215385 RepID=A0ABW2V0V6_9BACL|nr:M23 family metallopeptidase [Paenibacillus thermoaerophilus]